MSIMFLRSITTKNTEKALLIELSGLSACKSVLHWSNLPRDIMEAIDCVY